MEITIKQINKIHNLCLKIFEAEDDDFVDRRKIVPRERAIMNILETLAFGDGVRKMKIWDIIGSNIFLPNNDVTIKQLKELGIEVKKNV